MGNVKVIKPQEGFQEAFLSTSADICIGGSSAGVGKTFAILLEPLRHIHVNGFNAVYFRRTRPMIIGDGGLWDTSRDIYYNINGVPNETALKWKFSNNDNQTSVKFSHLQYEKDLQNWQGNQICLLGFDELTQFTERQFFYLLSRNRSVCGVKPYVRATCNPDPDSWVKRFVQWWIDVETGYPIPERDGVLRYFVNDGGRYIWGDTQEEVLEKIPHLVEKFIDKIENFDVNSLVKSVTFIAGDIGDNKELLSKDAGYLGNLNAQSEADKSALLDGNWNMVSNADMVFSRLKLDEMEFNEWKYDEARKEKNTKRYITCDVALMGSDVMVLFAWHGFTIIDCIFIEKSIEAPECLELIIDFSKKHKVQRSHISFDRDGVGAFLKGYLSFANEIVNASTPLFKENYINLKAQMNYVMAGLLDEVYIVPEVANMMIKNERVIDRLKKELRAVRKRKSLDESKLMINKKDEQKNILGHSPDFGDAFTQRAYLYKLYEE